MKRETVHIFIGSIIAIGISVLLLGTVACSILEFWGLFWIFAASSAGVIISAVILAAILLNFCSIIENLESINRKADDITQLLEKIEHKK